MFSDAQNEELKRLIRETVHETLFQVGMDTDDHEQIKELRRDQDFLRNWRTSTEQVKRKSLLVALGVAVAGLCGILWLGIKSVFSGS